MKYIILACSNDKTFDIPRQLMEVNGEPIVKRTIRLLKENGIDDILITAKDKRFDDLGATRYEPLVNTYNYLTGEGYWIDAFPFELMNEPVCFIWGDVYFSEDAIKTIVETDTDSTLFFCTYENKSPLYIKEHDEPLAYKVVDTKLFKKHINRIKNLYDKGETIRNPIVWELYRSINGIDVNTHELKDNCCIINDESCDIDSCRDIIELRKKLGGNKMIKVEALREFTLEAFNKLEDIERKNPNKNEKGRLYPEDTFKCDEEICDYLMGNNPIKQAVVKILEVIPEEKVEGKIEYTEEPVKPKAEIKPKKKKSSKKKK